MLLGSMHALAQDYVPMIQSGKEWKVGDFHGPVSQTNKTEYYTLQGDTLIGDTSYTCWLCRYNNPTEEKTIYQGALREVNQRVYFIPSGEDKEYLLYDFASEIGDTIEVYNGTEGHGTVRCVITGKDIAKERHQTSRSHILESLLVVQIKVEDYNGDFIEDNDWIAGMGNYGRPMNNVLKMPGYYLSTFYCKNDQGYIYEDYILEDNISSLSRDIDSSLIYDLQGRRLSSEPRKGMYIQGGKKVMR